MDSNSDYSILHMMPIAFMENGALLTFDAFINDSKEATGISEESFLEMIRDLSNQMAMQHGTKVRYLFFNCPEMVKTFIEDGNARESA